MLKQFHRKSIAAGAAAAIFGALALSAGVAKSEKPPAVVVNTDLKPSALSTVQIINQQAAEVYDDDSPALSNAGNPIFTHTTSLNLDTLFTSSDFQADLNDGIANGGLLDVGIEPKGFCAGGLLGRAPGQPYRIPEEQIRKTGGLLNNTYLFEGSLQEAILITDVTQFAPGDGFWANMTLTVGNGPFGIGELKIDGSTDVSALLPYGPTPANLKIPVDLVIAYAESEPDSDDSAPAGLTADLVNAEEVGCVTVNATVVTVPLPSIDVGPAPIKQ